MSAKTYFQAQWQKYYLEKRGKMDTFFDPKTCKVYFCGIQCFQDTKKVGFPSKFKLISQMDQDFAIPLTMKYISYLYSKFGQSFHVLISIHDFSKVL